MAYRSSQTIYLVSVFLILLGAWYVTVGLIVFMAPNTTSDLHTRWRERNYIVSGIDPYDVSVLSRGMKPDAGERLRIVREKLGHEESIDSSGYPPWGLAMFLLLIPPGPLPFVKGVYASLCLIALGSTIWFAYSLGRRWGTGPAWLMAATVSGMFGNASALRWGQIGLILNGFLVLYLWLAARGRPVRSAFAMALALLKPTFAGLQAVAMLFRKQELALLVTVAICIIASLVPWFLTGVNPVELIMQMLRQSSYVTAHDVSILRLARSVMPYPVALACLTFGSLGVAAWLAWKYRAASALVTISSIAVIGRVFMYHRAYDNVMLVFPLITLGLLALKMRTKWAWMFFFAYGTTLWAPIPEHYGTTTLIMLSAIWLAGCVAICWHADLVPFISAGEEKTSERPLLAGWGVLRPRGSIPRTKDKVRSDVCS